MGWKFILDEISRATIADWIMAGATVIYVIATIVIMNANKKSVKMSEKQIQEAREQFEKQQKLSIRPYINAYVARDGGNIDNKQHYSMVIDGKSDISCNNCRQFSIKNIGNGSAENVKIEITIEDDVKSRKTLPVRNGFLLVDQMLVYNLFFNEFKDLSICCSFADLYDNEYKQEMKIYYDTDLNDIVARTSNPHAD